MPGVTGLLYRRGDTILDPSRFDAGLDAHRSKLGPNTICPQVLVSKFLVQQSFH